MLLVADIGNTNIVIALHDGKQWIHSWRVYSDLKKTGDEYFIIFKSLLESSNLNTNTVTKAIISSVVPNLTMSIKKNLARLFNIDPMIVTNDINSGLLNIPAELGSDLLCNLVYAHHKYPKKNVMVIDFGTALSFSTVAPSGAVLGVAILPGIITSVNSLFGSTAQLPQVELQVPYSVLGRNTVNSIRAGIMYGYKGVVENIIEKTEQEIGDKLHTIITGGLSFTISPIINRIDEIDKFHTLNGLKLLAELN